MNVQIFTQHTYDFLFFNISIPSYNVCMYVCMYVCM